MLDSITSPKNTWTTEASKRIILIRKKAESVDVQRTLYLDNECKDISLVNYSFKESMRGRLCEN